MNCNNIKDLKIFHWNANSISNFSKLKQLEYVLEKEKVNIASLNDTLFNENSKPYLHNYLIYRNDRQDSRGGGFALLIRRSIKHKQLPHYNTKSIENISIEIYVNNKTLVISSVYSPRFSRHFADDLQKITSINRDFIIFRFKC